MTRFSLFVVHFVLAIFWLSSRKKMYTPSREESVAFLRIKDHLKNNKETQKMININPNKCMFQIRLLICLINRYDKSIQSRSPTSMMISIKIKSNEFRWIRISYNLKTCFRFYQQILVFERAFKHVGRWVFSMHLLFLITAEAEGSMDKIFRIFYIPSFLSHQLNI